MFCDGLGWFCRGHTMKYEMKNKHPKVIIDNIMANLVICKLHMFCIKYYALHMMLCDKRGLTLGSTSSNIPVLITQTPFESCHVG